MLYKLIMTNTRMINIRVTDDEAKLLAEYAKETGRTQTDVLREFIRSLNSKLTR